LVRRSSLSIGLVVLYFIISHCFDIWNIPLTSILSPKGEEANPLFLDGRGLE
jgi:hypothetical protein